MIYLRDLETNDWKEFELSDTQALKERKIEIDDNVYIGDSVYIDNGVTIKSYAHISLKAKLGLNVYISHNAYIGYMAVIGDNAYINNSARIGFWGKVPENNRPNTILITGKYNISYWGEDKIQIGRAVKSIDYWLGESGIDILKMFKIPEDQIAKYVGYIAIIKSIHEIEMKRKNS